MEIVARIARGIDWFNERVGRVVAWVALIMVLTQFIVVEMRYIFGSSSIFMQESIFYMHGVLFMIGASYTLLHNGHVRVDIFYREASRKHRAFVDLAGVIVFLLPISVLIWWAGWSYVARSWSVFEGSQETSGIPGIFLLKTVILVFATLVPLQGISMAARSVLVLADFDQEPVEEERLEGL